MTNIQSVHHCLNAVLIYTCKRRRRQLRSLSTHSVERKKQETALKQKTKIEITAINGSSHISLLAFACCSIVATDNRGFCQSPLIVAARQSGLPCHNWKTHRYNALGTGIMRQAKRSTKNVLYMSVALVARQPTDHLAWKTQDEDRGVKQSPAMSTQHDKENNVWHAKSEGGHQCK
ncbi:hypothetical protein VTO42DRAFT_655 [Malbranchea cinnamomea]